MSREEHIIRFLRTDNAWDDYGDPHLAYDEARQELEVLVSRTHLVDGRKFDTTPNGFNSMVPFGLDQTPDFTHYRQMVVTHLGIDYDAVTEIKYVIRDKEPLYPYAWGEVLFGGNEPILQRVVAIQAPIMLKLQVKSEGGAPGPIGSPVDGIDKLERFVCEMKNLPATNLSEAGAIAGLSLPRVSFSSCHDWKTWADEVNRRFAAAMKSGGALARDLETFKNVSDAQQKLDSLTTFFSDRVSTKSYDDLGFLLSFRSADQTYNTGYGSPADLAVLYAASLENLGFQPDVYLVCRRGLPVVGVHGSEKFSILLAVDGREAWLDPAAHELSFQSKKQLNHIGIYPPAEPKMLRVSLPEESVCSLDLAVNFKEDKTAEGWINLRTAGHLSQFDEARTQNPKELVEHWTSGLFVAPEISEARFATLEVLRVAAKANLKFAAPEKLQDGMIRLDIPWTSSDVDGLLPANLPLNYGTRDLPLFLPNVGAFEVRWLITYPEKWALALIPEFVASGAPGIALTRSVEPDGHQLVITERLQFTGEVVQPADWDAWRNVLLAANQASDRAILLKIESEDTKQAQK
jgi:hypothetical protein